MAFVELTAESGKLVLVNLDKVATIQKTYTGRTALGFVAEVLDQQFSIYVEDSYETIRELVARSSGLVDPSPPPR